MIAEIISTGTEILLGQTLNTNAQYIAQKLATIGISVYYQTTVGDNAERLAVALQQALQRADIVVTTGGLGPTLDDLTKETVARVWGLETELHPDLLAKIEGFFISNGREFPPGNRKQAVFPKGSQIIPNELGTAPGAIVEKDNKTVIILPGPPFEMQPMFEQTVEPYLLRRTQGAPAVIRSRVLRVYGPGESGVEKIIHDLIAVQSNPTMALLAKAGEIQIRITARGASAEEAGHLIAAQEEKIRQRVGKYIFGSDEESLAVVVGKMLHQRGFTLATAESCTGGLIAKLMTDVAGSSEYYLGGVVSYSNESKSKFLGVKPETLTKYGAVSPQVAAEMAHGIREQTASRIGVSVTGIAGPGGGSAEKPVGLVYAGLVWDNLVKVWDFRFYGDRNHIRLLTANAVLNMLRLILRSV